MNFAAQLICAGLWSQDRHQLLSPRRRLFAQKKRSRKTGSLGR